MPSGLWARSSSLPVLASPCCTALRLVRGRVCTQRQSQAGNSESKRPDGSEPGTWALVFRETDGKHRTRAWEARRGKLLTLSQPDPAVS